MFEARLAGRPKPWTDDPILQTYKFCNVFRAADRVSQFLIRDVAYRRDPDTTKADRAFQIVAFRIFSNIATWRGLTAILGSAPRLDHLRDGSFEKALDQVKAANGKLYTGAFILPVVPGFDQKHRGHVSLFRHMFLEKACAERILQLPSLEAVVKLLEGFPTIGPFLSYQIAIDLNYSELIDFDENDFTQAGVGAVRGLKKAFVSFGDYTYADTIRLMVDRQDEEFTRLALPFNGLFGRKLHAIDCQGLFCEVDKYCRMAAPELESNRTRIKARYNADAATERIELFFPPKWGLLVR